MPQDLENLSKQELIALVRKQHHQSRKLEQKSDSLREENAYLKEQVLKLNRLKFGQSKETFINPDQALLPFELPAEEKEKLEEQTSEKITYERKKPSSSSHPGRTPLPDHLPIEEVRIQPEEDTSDMVCIGTEVTDELECRPATLFIKRYIRYKYAPRDKAEGKILIGSLPGRIIEKGIAGPSLIASILVDKYTDHLPMHRQI
ncbi:MAG: IS66 family transposase, partial [Sphingobacteriales bacterium]